MTEKSPSLAAFTELVDISFSLCRAVQELQARDGGFDQLDLIAMLVNKHGLTVETARQRTTEHMAHLKAIAETKTSATITHSATEVRGSPRRRPAIPFRSQPIQASEFDRFRPQPSAEKWRRGAPSYVAACYEDSRRPDLLYTVVFTWWRAETAMANWRAGLNPRVQWCLRMSRRPDHPSGRRDWEQVLRGRRLGKLIAWRDLPESIRAHVRMRVQAARGRGD